MLIKILYKIAQNYTTPVLDVPLHTKIVTS